VPYYLFININIEICTPYLFILRISLNPITRDKIIYFLNQVNLAITIFIFLFFTILKCSMLVDHTDRQ